MTAVTAVAATSYSKPCHQLPVTATLSKLIVNGNQDKDLYFYKRQLFNMLHSWACWSISFDVKGFPKRLS